MFNHWCYNGLNKPKTHTHKVLCTLYYVHNPLMHTTVGSYVVACSHDSGEFTTFIIPSRLIPLDGQQQFVWLYTWQTHRHITPCPSASKLIIALLSGLIGTSICPSISPAASTDSPRYPQCGAPEILRHSTLAVTVVVWETFGWSVLHFCMLMVVSGASMLDARLIGIAGCIMNCEAFEADTKVIVFDVL